MKTLNVILYSYLVVFAILGSMTLFVLSLPLVYGQGTPTATPATTTTIQGSSSNNNLEFLKQKAFVYTLPPQGENIPQGSTFGGAEGQTGIVATILAAATGAFGIYTKISSKRDHDANQEKAKQNAEQIVTISDVQTSQNKTMFNLAPEDKVKAMEGTAPEIRQAKLQENKEKAVENAAKA